MKAMKTAKAVLALFVSAALTAPASAQVRVAASVAGSALPRVSVSAPLALSAAPLAAPSLNLSAAPAFSPSAFAALAAPSAPVALGAAAAPLAAAAAVPAAAVAAAAPAAVPLAAASVQVQALSSVGARAAALPEPSAVPAASLRSRWEGFWSGSSSRPDASIDAPVDAAGSGRTAAAAPLSRPSASSPMPVRSAAAAALLVPAAHGVSSFLGHAAPFLEGGAVLVGTYFVNRAVHALLNRIAAKRNMDRHQLAAIRLVVSAALWTGAAAGALLLGGASHATMATAVGAGGTILTLGLKDVLGNVIQGVNFLVTRPYSIGARVQLDDQVGTVSDATLTGILIKKDDGSEVKIRHSALAAKPVIVFGVYTPDAKLHLGVPAKPKFQGALGAVWKSLDRRFWISAAAFAAFTAVPPFVPFLAAGWIATAVHLGLAGSLAWLTRRVVVALTAAIDHLAAQNSWKKETTVMARLIVSAGLWAIGGGAVLRLIGVTWTMLGASLGLTTLGIGLASNNFFGSVVQGGEVLFSKPFKVGDHVKIGTFEGTVEDMTLYHVVLKLDEGRHALVPYAVVRDATLVVTPGK